MSTHPDIRLAAEVMLTLASTLGTVALVLGA